MIPTTRIHWHHLRSNGEDRYWSVRTALVMASAALLMGVVAAPRAHGQNFTTLWNFSGSSGDGSNPQSVLILSGGNLYGTTVWGGTGLGTIFKLSSSGATSTPTIYSFAGAPDGVNPYAGLVADGSGNFYGTTAGGGDNSCGMVFKMSANGVQPLHSFNCTSDGAFPYAALTIDPTGTILYGTTAYGGSAGRYAGFGTIFTIATSGGNFATLHTFVNTDGANPTGSLILDSAGNLYGTTQYGGPITTAAPNPAGTVFMFNTSTSVLTELYTFSGGSDGANPYAGVVQDSSSGNLFGTTVGGGLGYGTVFELTPTSTTPVTYNPTTLYAFTGGADGAQPFAGVALGASGTLYGAAASGGSTSNSCNAYFSFPNVALGCGAIFELVPPTGTSTTYTFSVKHTFNYGDGAAPSAGLLIDSSGNLYGTTQYGGTSANNKTGGTVFKITASTPKELIHLLIGQVQGLVKSGALNSGEGTSLVAHLNSALRLLNMSNTTATISNLNGFIYEVQGLESGGQLDPTDAQTLINAAQNIINLITTT